MSTPNTESHFHLAEFVVENGKLFVPLSSIASITYDEDEDQWVVNTVDGAGHDIQDEQGEGIHSITVDVVTWQVRPDPASTEKAILDAIKALQARDRAAAAAEGSVAS